VIQVNEVIERLKTKELELTITDESKEFIIDKGFDEKYGARPLKRAVERYLEDPLAEAILRGDVKKGDPIHVIVTNHGLGFEQVEPTPEVPSNQ